MRAGRLRGFALFLLLPLLVACGSEEKTEPAPLARCLKEQVGNYVEAGSAGARVPEDLRQELPPELQEETETVLFFRPLDPTFGEEIDGVITAPAAAAFALFPDAATAERFGEEAVERSGNVLIFYAREPTSSQEEAVDDCL